MRRRVARIAGQMTLVLTLTAAAASAQDAGSEPHLRWSVEGAAGGQLVYTGTFVSAGFGFAPTRSLTLLVSAERSRTEDEVDYYPDGYAATRGGEVAFVSGEVRYAFFVSKRIHPYVVGGLGGGMERPNINQLFPFGVDRRIVALYYGGGARIPLHRRLDAFADWRLIATADDGAEMAVLGPLRGGLSFRF